MIRASEVRRCPAPRRLDVTQGVGSSAQAARSILDPLLVECFIHPSTILVRYALVDRVGEFDETLHSVEIYGWYLRLAYHTGAEFVDDPLVHVRRHDGQISGQREVVAYEEMAVLLGAPHQRFDLTWKQRVLIRQGAGAHQARVDVRERRRRKKRTAPLP